MIVTLPCGVTATVRDGDESDSTILAELERDDYRIAELRNIATVLDVGAHIGLVAATIATMTGATVDAYEPEPLNFALLTLNVADIPGVHPRNLAVYDDSPTVQITYGRSGLTRVDPDGDHQAEATTLDAAITGMGAVDFLKMDTEGAELTILRSARRLGDVGQVALEYHRDGDLAELLQLLEPTHTVEVCPKSTAGGMLYAVR